MIGGRIRSGVNLPKRTIAALRLRYKAKLFSPYFDWLIRAQKPREKTSREDNASLGLKFPTDCSMNGMRGILIL